MAAMDDPTLRELSQTLGEEWEKLGSFLGMKYAEIYVIKLDYPLQTENQIFNMLVKWKQQQASDVDQRATLCAALRKSGRMDLADKHQGDGQCSSTHCAQQECRVSEVTVTTAEQTPTETLLPVGRECTETDDATPSHSHHPRDPGHVNPGSKDNPMPVTADKIGELDGTKETEEADGMPPCHKHKAVVIEFLCENCRQLICRECTKQDHCRPTHQYVHCKMACEKYKQSLQNVIPVLSTELEYIKRCREETVKLKEDLRRKVLLTVEEVRARAAAVAAEVKAEEKRLIDEIRALEQERNLVFDTHVERAEAMLQTKQRSLEAASAVAAIPSESKFLTEYLKVSDSTVLLSRNPFQKAERRLAYLSFEQSERVMGDMCLGRLELGGTWKMVREFGRRGSGTGEFDMVKGVAARQPNQIEVADYMNKRVVVCGTDGQVINTIPLQGVPRDIAAMRNQLVVVTDATHVQIYHKNINTATILGKKKSDFRSVALKKDGTIIVGDVVKDVLTEHSRTDGTLRRTIPVKIKPYFITIDSQGGTSRERVIISSGYQKEVHVNDFSGNTLCRIRPVIEGVPVYQCTGVSCDATGIYVALNTGDRDSGHVHHYDADGRYQSCVANGLHNPQGMTFTTDGHILAVCDTYSVKLYQKM